MNISAAKPLLNNNSDLAIGGVKDSIQSLIPLKNWLFNWVLLIAILLSIELLVDRIAFPNQPLSTPKVQPVWGKKPVLAYFLFTESLAEQMITDQMVSKNQYQIISEVASRETMQLHKLEQESLVIIQDPTLSLDEKRVGIIEMGYNRRVDEILKTGQQALQNRLSIFAYQSFVKWIENQWQLERQEHGVIYKNLPARTYKIFATRYDSGGKYIVALPDKCLKFANAGNHICDDQGYSIGQEYTVYLSYKQSTAAMVLESGPWNVDDNYWASIYDPQPRRMFGDLATGMPEAQAAYFNGYNGGLDQYGRKVTAPFGIDLAPEVSNDIGLKGSMNDWINITFMWTEGWGAGGEASTGNGTTKPAIIAVQVATANPDGSIIHEVQQGQSLWNIADAYQITLQEILSLNNLTKDSLIFPGQKLIIKEGTMNTTPSPSLATTSKSNVLTPSTLIPAKAMPSPSAYPPLVPSATEYNQDTVENTEKPESTVTHQNARIDSVFLIIVGLLVVGTALVLLGTLTKKK